jgi:hypothetical protein
MNRIAIASALALGLALSAPAMAGPSHYRHGHWGHAHVSGDAALIGAGIFVGALALGSLLSAPRYAPPPVVYYRQPRSCVQDMVYRTLPDGRIQSGTRTTCY